MIPTANEFIKLMSPEENKTFRLGKIDPAYASGRPKVIFDGEAIESAKQYPYLGSYNPVAEDRVLLLVIANSYVIIGKII